MIKTLQDSKSLKNEENCLLYYFSPIPPSSSTAEYNQITRFMSHLIMIPRCGIRNLPPLLQVGLRRVPGQGNVLNLPPCQLQVGESQATSARNRIQFNARNDSLQLSSNGKDATLI